MKRELLEGPIEASKSERLSIGVDHAASPDGAPVVLSVTDDGHVVLVEAPGVRVTAESVGEMLRVDSVREGTNLLTRWFAPDEVAAVMAALRAWSERE